MKIGPDEIEKVWMWGRESTDSWTLWGSGWFAIQIRREGISTELLNRFLNKNPGLIKKSVKLVQPTHIQSDLWIIMKLEIRIVKLATFCSIIKKEIHELILKSHPLCHKALFPRRRAAFYIAYSGFSKFYSFILILQQNLQGQFSQVVSIQLLRMWFCTPVLNFILTLL